MIKKVFTGVVNGKEFSSKEDYLTAINKALEDGGKIDASSSFKEVTIPDAPKTKEIESDNKALTVKRDKEIARFTDNLKKFNDMFEKQFAQDTFSFKKLFSDNFMKQFNSLF